MAGAKVEWVRGMSQTDRGSSLVLEVTELCLASSPHLMSPACSPDCGVQANCSLHLMNPACSPDSGIQANHSYHQLVLDASHACQSVEADQVPALSPASSMPPAGSSTPWHREPWSFPTLLVPVDEGFRTMTGNVVSTGISPRAQAYYYCF